MDIKPLRYYVTLAEMRHFGRAAKRLNLSQPPLSRQLIALEESLGVKLIERSSHHVELTAAGEQFYLDARAILAAMDQAAHNARAAAAGIAGSLRVGFTMCAAYSVVPGYARQFNASWPNVTLHLREVVSNDLVDQVLAGQVDAAILLPGSNSDNLESRTVVREPLCVALSRHHPRANARRIAIKQLAGEPFVMAAEDSAPFLRSTIISHCRKNGFNPDIRLEVQLQQTVLSLVDEGVGVALVPQSMRKSKLSGVVFRPLVEAPLVEQVLVWSKANHNPCLEKFLDIARPVDD